MQDAVSMLEALELTRSRSVGINDTVSDAISWTLLEYELAVQSWIGFLKEVQPIVSTTDAKLESLERPLSNMTVASVLFKLGDSAGADAALKGMSMETPSLEPEVVQKVATIEKLTASLQNLVGLQSESLIVRLKALQAHQLPFLMNMNEVFCGVSQPKLLRDAAFDDLINVSASYGWQLRMLRKVKERAGVCKGWIDKLEGILSNLGTGSVADTLISVSRSDSISILQNARAALSCTSDALTAIYHELLVCEPQKS
jgi:hypothetical protein